HLPARLKYILQSARFAETVDINLQCFMQGCGPGETIRSRSNQCPVNRYRLIISDAPRCRHGSQIDSGYKPGAIHEPDNALTRRGVLPKNIRLTIPVEVARPNDAPGCRHRSQIDSRLKRGAIHEPDDTLTSRGVLPKNVRLAVPVKI